MRVIDVAFAIAVGVLFYLILVLGLNLAFPEPEYSDYCNVTQRFEPCMPNMTVGECREIRDDPQCQNLYQDAREQRDTWYFVMASFLGLLTIVISSTYVRKRHIAAALVIAGVVLVFFAYMVGWEQTSDLMKFIAAVITGLIVLYFGYRDQSS